MDGMREAQKRMPTVYRWSVELPEELEKFPLLGEQEMMEQECSVDLSGEVQILRETFCLWIKYAALGEQAFPCGTAIYRYAVDQQSIDLRGSVGGDSAWELCCRQLSRPSDLSSLSSRDLAQLVVYWLEEYKLPEEMREVLYWGMKKDLFERGKKVETDQYEQAMKWRWVEPS